MSTAEATTSCFSPQGNFTGRSSGDHLTTFLLWHPLFSPLTEVVLHGWGWYTCPMYDSWPYTREHQSLMQQEVSLGQGLMTFHIGSSLGKGGHQPQFDAPPPKSLLPTYP